MNDDKPDSLLNAILDIKNTVGEIDEKLDIIYDKQSDTQTTVEDINDKEDKIDEKLGKVLGNQSVIYSTVSETKETANDLLNKYKDDTVSPMAKIKKVIGGFFAVISLIASVIAIKDYRVKQLLDKAANSITTQTVSGLSEDMLLQKYVTEELTVEESSASELVHESSMVVEEQEYPNDYIISWEDETFGKMVEAALSKGNVTYGDVKDIHKLEICGQFMVVDSETLIIDEIYINDENANLSYFIINDNKYNIEEFISLNDLKYFNSLDEVIISFYKSINCNIFSDSYLSNNLRNLTIACTKLDSSNIEDIANLQNITTLCLDEVFISNFEPLYVLTDLEILKLTFNNITDISFVKNMTNLKKLDLSVNNISDINALSNLNNLETVILHTNEISDWTPVEKVKNVIKLEQNAKLLN